MGRAVPHFPSSRTRRRAELLSTPSPVAETVVLKLNSEIPQGSQTRNPNHYLSSAALSYFFDMLATKTPDLSKAALFLGSFVGVDDILNMSENSRYEFQPPATDADISWRGGQCKEELKPPILCLMIGEHLFDPRGWVIGSHSDSDECDLQVAKNNQTGISRRFIRVDISPVTHNPRVTVLSGRTIRIRDGDRILICRPGEPTEFSRPVTVDLGQVSFRAWPPMRSNTAREYQKWANVFSKDILLAVPKYLPSINGQLETATHNVRYGRNDAVYVNEVGLGCESKGMSASVFMVKDRTTGNIFGAKEPYYKTSDNHDTARKRFEALQKEYEHIMQLDHVCKCSQSLRCC